MKTYLFFHVTKRDHYHKDTAAFKEHFIEDVKKVDDSFSANPFEVDSFSPINKELNII